MRLLPERYDSCMVPCLYLHTTVYTDESGTISDLEIAPKDETDLWRSTIFSEVLADFFRFSHDVKQRGKAKEFEGRP